MLMACDRGRCDRLWFCSSRRLLFAAFRESARADPYTVVKGDTLEKIAKRTGTTVADLVARNKLRDANHIRIGTVLDVPAPPPAVPVLPKPILYTVKAGDTALRLAKTLLGHGQGPRGRQPD